MDWNDYFWPGSNVLRNKLGLTDGKALREEEYKRTAVRRMEIDRGSAPIPKTLDAKHLCALHGWLFQDVYDFAGQYRQVQMSKELSNFAPVARIGECLRRATDVVSRTRWDRVNDAGFAAASAETFGWLNYAHPFREGNGRATRAFMTSVAEKAGRWLDYNAIDEGVWNQRSAFSVPTLGEDRPAHQWLVPVFWAMARQDGASQQLAAPGQKRDSGYDPPGF